MRVFQAIERLHHGLGVLSGLMIFVITLIVVIDVAMRALFNMPIPGATELSTLLLVALIYLGLAAVQASKQNYRVEILIGTVAARTRAALNILTTLLSMIAIGILAWFTLAEAWHATATQEMTFGAIVFPVWPARIAVALGLTLLTLQLLMDTIRLCLGLQTDQGESGGLQE
ncbi:TRAP transporter small permease subunit [Xinfangfangia pollutisoli]|uniref:TRAP transporter small permease subunit n=1 Tax=Xinfangfangia pollutisoli TaxID=2865960 RepID=UPI001CD50C2E|nr:TRAP transporter small permease [Xinfangfangia pollutisoli]